MSQELTPVQQAEALKRRLEALSARQLRASTLLEAEKQRLEEARAEAGVEYGAETVDELKAILERMRTETRHKLTALAKALDEAEAQLQPVERLLAQ